MFKGLLAILLCCSAAMSASSEKPNFSGTWKLNLADSDLGPMPAPKEMILKIVHKDPDLIVTTLISGGPQGDLNYEAKYTTDGKETVNRLAGHDAHCTVTWDHDTLLLKTTADFGAGTVTIESRWNLLQDGKVLKQSAHVSAAQGSFDPTYVFDKETIR